MKEQCPSCQSMAMGNFCSECGEQRLADHQRSILGLLEDLVSGLYSADSKLLRSLKMIFFNHGLAAANFNQGRRVAYMRPVGIFLFVNLVYMALTVLNDFNVSLYDQLHSQPYSALIKDSVIAWIDHSGLSRAEFQSAYNQVVKLLAKSLIVISIPLLALILPLILPINHQRRWLDLLVYSTYCYASILLWQLVIGYGARAVNSSLLWLFDTNLNTTVSILTILTLSWFIWFSYTGLKNAFQLSAWQSAWRTPLLIGLIFVSHEGYRFFQLFITLYFIETPESYW